MATCCCMPCCFRVQRLSPGDADSSWLCWGNQYGVMWPHHGPSHRGQHLGAACPNELMRCCAPQAQPDCTRRQLLAPINFLSAVLCLAPQLCQECSRQQPPCCAVSAHRARQPCRLCRHPLFGVAQDCIDALQGLELCAGLLQQQSFSINPGGCNTQAVCKTVVKWAVIQPAFGGATPACTPLAAGLRLKLRHCQEAE